MEAQKVPDFFAASAWRSVLTGVSFVLFLVVWLTILIGSTAVGDELLPHHTFDAGWNVDFFFTRICIARITNVPRPPPNSPLWAGSYGGFYGINWRQSIEQRWKDRTTMVPGQFCRHTMMWIPAAWPLCVTFLLPMAWFVERFRARRRVKRRLRKGLCPWCGYDLRASQAQCPECGRPKPAKKFAVPGMMPAWAIVLLVITAIISVPLVGWMLMVVVAFWDFRVAG